MSSPADYRVRLFLSVDLSGSTAFKASSKGVATDNTHEPKWVSSFHHFYSDFPARYKANYSRTTISETPGKCPVVWKAVGDELVFCGRVETRKCVAVALLSFINTLHDYRKYLLTNCPELDVKGAGWLAAFPEPNRAVRVRIDAAGEEYISASEELEQAADQSPYDFDFLGKAIDTGFRVAHLATPERFAISVQLARLIAQMPRGFGFDYSVRLDTPIILKGVNRGVPYPFLYIDTMEHLSAKACRLKERQLLGLGVTPERELLRDYLDDYCELVGTDPIALPELSATEDIPLPRTYLILRPQIEEHFQQEALRAMPIGLSDPPSQNSSKEESEADTVTDADNLISP